ncbi:MAG: hypothetical protein AVDCRST_MAG57-3300, partial [uncultured Blastococcus sp.]
DHDRKLRPPPRPGASAPGGPAPGSAAHGAAGHVRQRSVPSPGAAGRRSRAHPDGRGPRDPEELGVPEPALGSRTSGHGAQCRPDPGLPLALRRL